MNARKTAQQIVSNISAFCVGYFGRPIPTHAVQALVRSSATELESYRPLYERKGAAVYRGDKFIYQLASDEQAQELVDALSTYV